MEFNVKLTEFFNKFGSHKNMVLSTSYNNEVDSRMMSIICYNGKFYFQTDKNFKKCQQIKANSKVSLCIDNISVKGICKCVGKPVDNLTFCKLFNENFQKAYNLYTGLESEVLFEVEPIHIKCWIYENDTPYIEEYELNKKIYSKKSVYA